MLGVQDLKCSVFCNTDLPYFNKFLGCESVHTSFFQNSLHETGGLSCIYISVVIIPNHCLFLSCYNSFPSIHTVKMHRRSKETNSDFFFFFFVFMASHGGLSCLRSVRLHQSTKINLFLTWVYKDRAPAPCQRPTTTENAEHTFWEQVTNNCRLIDPIFFPRYAGVLSTVFYL